jgi:ABC-type transport system involved in cytochrome bd biosynthesis fused ATPase/permease subunit
MPFAHLVDTFAGWQTGMGKPELIALLQSAYDSDYGRLALDAKEGDRICSKIVNADLLFSESWRSHLW